MACTFSFVLFIFLLFFPSALFLYLFSFHPSFLSLCPLYLFLVLVFLCAGGRHKWVRAASSALRPPMHQHAWQLQVHLPAGAPPAGRWQILRWPGASAQLWKSFIRLPHISILPWAQLLPTAVPQLGLSELPLLHGHHKGALQEP